MQKLIQLIWDFRGPDATKTAEHQAIHLREFVAREQWTIQIIDYKPINDLYAIAYMVVNQEQMRALRDVLKPHRGVYWEENT